MLVERNFTVFIYEIFEENNLRKSALSLKRNLNVKPENIRRDNYYYETILLNHSVKMKSRLRGYLSGKKQKNSPNTTNDYRARNAKIYSLKIWGGILVAIETLQSTNQTHIAKWLNENEYTTRTGGEISQPHIMRFIRNAGKEKEWESLVAEQKNLL